MHLGAISLHIISGDINPILGFPSFDYPSLCFPSGIMYSCLGVSSLEDYPFLGGYGTPLVGYAFICILGLYASQGYISSYPIRGYGSRFRGPLSRLFKHPLGEVWHPYWVCIIYASRDYMHLGAISPYNPPSGGRGGSFAHTLFRDPLSGYGFLNGYAFSCISRLYASRGCTCVHPSLRRLGGRDCHLFVRGLFTECIQKICLRTSLSLGG